jgi:hypothetical protein
MDVRGLLTDLMLHVRITPSRENHIFVLGPPRSGTTLVRGILAAHSKITITDKETFFFVRRRVSLFEIQEVPEFSSIIKFSRDKVKLFDYIAQRLKESTNAEVFMEKTPEHALVLGKLLRWYPKSKFVFVVRDGRDSYSSAFRNPELKKVGDNYPELWRDSVRSYLENRQASNMTLLRYEELVGNPEYSINSLMNFLKIPVESSQFDPSAFSQTSMAKQPGHEMLSSPINSSSVGAFRQRLSPKQIAFFENYAGFELDELGYDI